MTPAELARQLLMDGPGDAFCDPCLALACGTTLTEMRSMAKTLLASSASFQQDSTCASCRRTVPAIVYQHPKCAHCSHPFDAGDPGLLMGGERFHVHCLRRLITDETIQLSQTLSRRSRELIEQSRRRSRSGEARFD